MGKSWHIATFWGIPLKIHWSFLFILAYVSGLIMQHNSGVLHGIWLCLFVFGIFASVIMHEYGHALAAKKYGIHTVDIMIMPIGGVARLQQLPEKPLQEMFIAIAGPLVNVALVILMSVIYLSIRIGTMSDYNFDIAAIGGPEEFLIYLIGVNLMLFLFNLVPAFPMDGGRILRAGLAIPFGRLKATKIATAIGQGMAVLFLVYGLFNGQFGLAFIGIYVFLAARSELGSLKFESKLSEVSANDVMKTTFPKLFIGDDADEVWEQINTDTASDYVVVNTLGYPVGWITRSILQNWHKQHLALPDNTKLMQIMGKNLVTVAPKLSLTQVVETMQSNQVPLALVKQDDEWVGIITRDVLKL